MKPEKLSEAIGSLDDGMIQEAGSRRTKRKRRPLWISIAAAAACLAVTAGVVLTNLNGTGIRAAASPEYPQMAHYPDIYGNGYDEWRASRIAQLSAPEGYADGLRGFYAESTREFLSGDTENRVYSPLNLYMALALLAETASGESRRQILSLLGSDSIEALREQAGRLWNANYCNDGAITSVLANSVWLADGLDFRRDTAGTLAKNYFASVYQADFGTDRTNSAIGKWIDQQTGGFLKESTGSISTSPDTLFALYSTVYFRAKWRLAINKSDAVQKEFHAADGDVTAEFMNASDYADYFWGENYSASRLKFKTGCEMYFILPDEDSSIDEVLSSEDFPGMLCGEFENSRNIRVNYSIPKFDIFSTTYLNDGMKALGITDVFAPASADFSEFLDDDAYLDAARQTARVSIDEEGCTAASFVEMAMAGSGAPPENADEVDFTLDRPFIFVITGMDGQPLFTGTVYQP